MSLEQEFKEAVQKSRELKSRPSNEELLRLYGLFKQCSEGDIIGERPGGFDFKGAAKYDAWESEKGKTSEIAMREYINLVDSLHKREA